VINTSSLPRLLALFLAAAPAALAQRPAGNDTIRISLDESLARAGALGEEARIARANRPDLAFAPVGQVVGSMNDVRPVRDVMYRLVEEYIETTERLSAGLEG